MSSDAYYLSLVLARDHVRWARKAEIWQQPTDAFAAIGENRHTTSWEEVIEKLAHEWRAIMAPN